MARLSKSELKESQREHKDRTGDEVRESDDIVKDGQTASGDFSDQQEPSLSDTADELNAIAADLKSEIQEQHGEQAEKVDESIDGQRRDVSDPARDDEKIESAAADGFDAASVGNKRFGKILAEAGDQRRDAEIFLNELAETDETDQQESSDTLSRHRQEVEDAIQNIREF
jgi:hypothetical protein